MPQAKIDEFCLTPIIILSGHGFILFKSLFSEIMNLFVLWIDAFCGSFFIEVLIPQRTFRIG